VSHSPGRGHLEASRVRACKARPTAGWLDRSREAALGDLLNLSRLIPSRPDFPYTFGRSRSASQWRSSLYSLSIKAPCRSHGRNTSLRILFGAKFFSQSLNVGRSWRQRSGDVARNHEQKHWSGRVSCSRPWHGKHNSFPLQAEANDLGNPKDKSVFME
jgi:hypothetical protein